MAGEPLPSYYREWKTLISTGTNETEESIYHFLRDIARGKAQFPPSHYTDRYGILIRGILSFIPLVALPLTQLSLGLDL